MTQFEMRSVEPRSRITDAMRLNINQERFSLQTDAQLQIRSYWREVEGVADEERFTEARRAKIGLRGHVFNQRFGYRIRGGYTRPRGKADFENVYVQSRLSERYVLRMGQFKGAFMREDGVSTSYLQAVERTAINAIHTIAFTRGAVLMGEEESRRWSLSVHKGRFSQFDADEWAEFAATGRFDWALRGELNDFREFAAWSGSENGALLGFGFDGGTMKPGGNVDDFLAWTADLTLKRGAGNAMLSIIGRSASLEDAERPSQLGAVAQAGVFVLPRRADVFARWEWMDPDGYVDLGRRPIAVFDAEIGTMTAWGLGGNWYIDGHRSKFTADMVWAPDGVFRQVKGVGFAKTARGQSESLFRVQFQQLF